MFLRGRAIEAAFSASMALALCTRLTFAQTTNTSDEPIVIGQPQQNQGGLHLNPAQLSLDLTAAYSNASTKVGDASTRSSTSLFTQQLNLSTQGYYLHPNFLEFTFDGTAGVEEAFGDSDGYHSSETSPLYLWNFSATLLRNGDWPLTVYSNRTQNWIFRDFGPAIEAQTTDTGATVSHQTSTLNSQLTLDHIDSSQTGPSDYDSVSYTQDRVSWYGGAQLSLNQSLTWNYNYSHVVSNDPVEYEYTTNDATITDTLTFGDHNRSMLTSTVTGGTQQGLTDYSNLERFRWLEQLYLWHSAELQTRYGLTYDWMNVYNTTRQSVLGTAGFTHQLYQSLTTNGNIGVRQSEDSDGFSNTEAFGNIEWDYQKNVPYGILYANLGLGYGYSEGNGSGDNVIVGQSQTFNDPMPVVLTGNIDPTTIVLTDPSGLRYLPGIDYTTRDVPGGVEIDRVFGGRIGNGQSVLIDYVDQAMPPSSIQTENLSTGLRYYVDKGPLLGLSLYARYSAQRQSIDTATPSAFTLNDFDDYLYGVQYDINDFSTGYEHQIHDSTIYPYDADRVFARYWKQTGETTWSINGAFTRLNLPDDNDQINLYTISAQATHQFNTRLSGTATIMWRDEYDQSFGRTTGFEEQLGLQWNFRQIEAYIQLRASQLNGDMESQHFEFVQIGVRRYF